MGKDFSLAELYPLIAEGIKSGGTYRFYPKGVSMLPLLKEGKDSVVLSEVSSLKKGDMVLYRRENGMFVIHRIIKKSNTFTMCGDNQFLLEEGIKETQILAKVTAIYKKDKSLSLESFGYKLYKCFLPLRRFMLKIVFLAKRTVKRLLEKLFKSR